MRRLIALGGLLAVLAGCSGDDEPASTSTLGDEVGCELTPVETDELHVRELFTCDRGDETTDVYTFNSSSARDSWREIAEEFGTIVVGEGDTWLEVG